MFTSFTNKQIPFVLESVMLEANPAITEDDTEGKA